jgi:hypothetical protein
MKLKSATTVLVSVFLVLAAGDALLFRAIRGEGATISGLEREITECLELRAENTRLLALRPDPAEISRLRQENAELLKLRSQAPQLRRDIESQNSQEPESLRLLRGENEQLQQQQLDLRELPNRAACLKNLELMDAAKKQWAEQKGLQKGETVTLEVLSPFFPDGLPACPDGGHYSVNRVGSAPVCSFPGHSIP